jgi:hypothetical protein
MRTSDRAREQQFRQQQQQQQQQHNIILISKLAAHLLLIINQPGFVSIYSSVYFAHQAELKH